jgi:cytochrome c peroxidase
MHIKENPTIEGVRQTFARMGFNDRETTSLICGGHLYGRCHPCLTGYAGPWISNPIKFTNEYVTDLLGDKWLEITNESKECLFDEIRPAPGKRQYISLGDGTNLTPPKQMMLVSDMALLWDPKFKFWLEFYADEQYG